MDEQNTQSVSPQPEATVLNQQVPQGAGPGKKGTKKPLIIGLIVVLLLAAGAGAYFLFIKDKDNKVDSDKSTSQTEEQRDDTKDTADTSTAIECGDGYTAFADKQFGMAFCYPSEWGTASVRDAKVGADDTGHRQSVVFARNSQFSVGGTSDDWSTTVGRGVGCLEPNNTVAELSSYNTEWHDITDDFAQRSLETTAGGYDLTETVGGYDGGVCAQGHKVISGSRYRVAFAGYFSEFTAGVASVDAHVSDPYTLFGETDRTEFDKLLASVRAY